MRPGARPFEGTSALTRLAGYCGVTPREHLYDLFDFVNVLQYWPGRDAGGKYDLFPMDEARREAAVLDHVLLPWYKRVVILGRTTSKAFGLEDVPYLQWHDRLAILPHPGGTNVWWNLRRNKEDGIRFLRTDVMPWVH
jgi:hypothetical protein